MRISSNFVLLLAVGSLVGLGVAGARRAEFANAAERARVSVRGTGDAIEVPFRMLPSNHMVVEAKVNGKGPYRFIFDLGAPVTLLTNRAAEESGAVEKTARRSLVMGARGEAKVKQMKMGELVADDVPIIVMDHPALGALGGLIGQPLSGIIGYTFWARYHMTIDYQAKRMTFAPVDFEVQDLFQELPKRFSGPKRAQTIVIAPRALLGFSVSETKASQTLGAVEVDNVLSESAAERAGLMAGDLLLSIDGRWTTSAMDVYSAVEGLKPGRGVSIEVRRGEQTLALSLEPAEGL